jgi:hypothetical protein
MKLIDSYNKQQFNKVKNSVMDQIAERVTYISAVGIVLYGHDATKLQLLREDVVALNKASTLDELMNIDFNFYYTFPM